MGANQEILTTVPDHPEPQRASRTYSLGKLRYDAQPGPGYLRVEFEGEIDSVELADDWLEHIEDVLSEHGLARILWDSRPAMPFPSDVRAHFWAWLESSSLVRASAVLMHSEMLRVSANLSAVSRKLVLKAFTEPDVAIAWLSGIESAS